MKQAHGVALLALGVVGGSILGPCSAGAESFPGTEKGARALLERFVRPGADHAAMSRELRPTRADYDAVFTPDAAAKAHAGYEPIWESGVLVVRGKPEQTRVLVFSATTEDLRAYRGPAEQHFPGGYRRVAEKLKPGRTFYTFKFTAPGQDLGMAFDGLTYVNGNWRIFPKPWRVLE
jgi:hypothetical protein